MSHWNNTMVRGMLDVTDKYCITERMYNVSKISNNNHQVLGDDQITTEVHGESTYVYGKHNVYLEAKNGTTYGTIYLNGSTIVLNSSNYGTSLPTTGKTGQIYFKLIN